MNYLLGIDIGTTNVKLVLFNQKWEAELIQEKSIATKTPKAGHSEQDPEEVYNTTSRLLKKILLEAKKNGMTINGIGLSTAMHSFLAVDKNLKPLTNLLIWSDMRSAEVSESLKNNSTVKKYFEKSNVPIHPMLPLAKWLWFNQYAKNKKSVHRILTFKDYLIARWFGVFVIDNSMASSTGYYDLKENDWNHELLHYLKLDAKQLSEIKPTTYFLEDWEDEILQSTKQKHLPPLVLGSSDGCLSNLAAGVFDKTKASLTIGTSGAVRTAYSKPADLGQRLFCYPLLKDYYVVGGAVNNGGNVLEWFKKNLSPNTHAFWEKFDLSVLSIRPGSEGLIFLPYLHGERAPLWDPSLRGAYLGISNYHENIHFIRATLEGIAFALKHIFKLIDARPNTIKTVVADGGFTKSNVWVQLVCDVLGVEVFCPDQSYGAAKGAAMLCKIALGKGSLGDLTAPAYSAGEWFKPKKANKDVYEGLFLIYLDASSSFIRLNR